MRGLIIGIILAVTALEVPGQTKTVKDLFEAPAPKKDEDSRMEEGPSSSLGAVAEINGADITRADFLKVLYASAGSRVLRQMIGLELAKQMAAAERIQPSKDDLDREYRGVVLKLGPDKDTLGKTLTFEDRERLLRGIIRRRGMSFEEFQIGIEQQAYLRAVAKKKIKITEEMLKEEFDRMFGRKRKVRAIELQDMKVAESIFHRLQKGEDFATLATKYSIDFPTAAVGGQLGEIGPKDTKYPEIVVKTAFTLPEKKFSSPMRVETQYWIIKVDQEVPPVPITMEKVRPHLIEELSARLEKQMIEKMQPELFRNAKIKVYNKYLTKEFDRWQKEVQTNE
jgi:foldase protein PrsA